MIHHLATRPSLESCYKYTFETLSTNRRNVTLLSRMSLRSAKKMKYLQKEQPTFDFVSAAEELSSYHDSNSRPAGVSRRQVNY
jgi:hypothetical protein